MIIFVTGGARSGKSDFAQDLAEKRSGRRLFVATAEAFDDEMRARILNHKKRRGDRWDTVEEAIHLGKVMKTSAQGYDTVCIDCCTLWMSNLMGAYPQETERAETVIDEFFAGLEGFKGTLIVISNEVGLGIVPENALAREYRDRLGFLNQRMARRADRVYFMIAGMPLAVK